jgi:site-specific recombinase XerD
MANTELNHETRNFTSFKVAAAITEFLSDRRARGVSPATIVYYQSELRLFSVWLEGANAANLETMTPDIIRRYLQDLSGRRNRAGSHTGFRAIRAFLRWAWEEYDLAGRCPVSKVRIPAAPLEAKPGVKMDDFEKLLKAAKLPRDKAILLTLMDTGIRRRELVALSIGDLALDAGTILLTLTKNKKPRSVFFGAKTKKALRAYLRTRSPLPSDAPLFASRSGQRLSVWGLREIVRRICAAAGIKETGLHAFRRTFALEMLRNGADLVTVSRLLGHSSLEITKVYLAQNQDDLQAGHAKAGPVDKLKGG